MRTFIFIPPVKQAAGGITVLRRIGAILHAHGQDVQLVLRGEPGWVPADITKGAPEMHFSDLRLHKDDLWLVPEGWVNALAPGLEAGARTVSYVQNWAYLFSALPEGITWNQLPVEFLAVSDPVAHYITQATGKPVPVLRPGIDRTLFATPESSNTKPYGKPAVANGKPVRIAYMPRKNKAQAKQIVDLFHSRNPQADVRITPIEGLDAYGVADLLAKAHIFLMTGFPEGCPLPPLEAMASGCLTMGFSGYGGWDYMRQAQETPRFSPWWPLRDVPWGPNGLWCADVDVLDAALLLEEGVRWWKEDDPRLGPTLNAARQTADSYGLDAQEEAVLKVWSAYQS